MKIFSRLFLLGLGMLAFALPAQAKSHHHPLPGAPLATPAPEPGPLPAETAPRINPADPPSVSLQPFVDTHLGKALSPLGTSAFAQPEVLASLKASYADAMAAAPDAHKPAFALAMSVCDGLNGAITERQNAVAALRGALATRSSEAEQPRGGGQAVTAARHKDEFFIDSQKNTWLQHATTLREGINALYLRERAAERQVGVWTPPPPPPAAPAPIPAVAAVAAPMPSVSAPAAATPDASSQGPDPLVGQWLWGGTSKLTLGADHSITGERHGHWTYTWTTNGGRNYEFYWAHKGWVDYMVLSDDGKTLAGHTREQKAIAATRR